MTVRPQTGMVDGRVLPIDTVFLASGADKPRLKESWMLTAKDDSRVFAANMPVVVRERTHRAFLFSMAVFGLFYPKNFGNVGSRCWPLFAAYSLCVSLLHSVNAARMSVTYFISADRSSKSAESSIDSGFLLKITMYFWYLQIAVVAAIFFVKCWSKGAGGLASYYEKLNSVGNELALVGATPDSAADRRFEVVCLASAWLVFVAHGSYSMSYVLSALVNTDKSLLRWSVDDSTATAAADAGNSTTSLAEGWRNYTAAALVSLLVTVYGSGSTVFGVVYVLVLCRQLYSLLTCFNREVDQKTAADPHNFLPLVGHYRRLHGELCCLVARANGCIAHLIGVHICYSFGSSMIQAYLITTHNGNDLWFVTQNAIAVWLGTALAIIGIEFAACCVIIEKVQESEEYLERIPHSCNHDADSDLLVQLQLFLNQIKRDRGFSIFSIYPISKDSLLPMIGTWITYFLLIVQSSAPASSSSSVTATCNASRTS